MDLFFYPLIFFDICSINSPARRLSNATNTFMMCGHCARCYGNKDERDTPLPSGNSHFSRDEGHTQQVIILGVTGA